MQIGSVIRTTRPRHIVRAFVQPRHTLNVFKYHCRRVPERRFIEFLAAQRQISSENVDAAYADLDRNLPLWEQLGTLLSTPPKGFCLPIRTELSALYLLTRLTKPDCVIETGVASGASSAYILRAMHDNARGTLHSIDLPPDDLSDGKATGWIVPDSLKNRWHLYIGDSKELLKPLLSETGQIDCFLHDSLHTYDHMLWEFRTAWEYLCPGGLLLSHDVGRNRAFFDFMKEKDIRWKEYRVFHVLGGFFKHA